MKKILIVIGGVVIAVAIAAGSFYGGTAYQKNKADQIQENFFSERGGQPPTGGFQTSGNGQFPPGGQGGAFGRGLMGEIQALKDDTLMVTTNDGVVTVKLSATTKIQKTVDAATSDLTSGTTITIMGQQNDDGSISASQIQIVDPSTLQQFAPPATGTAP